MPVGTEPLSSEHDSLNPVPTPEIPPILEFTVEGESQVTSPEMPPSRGIAPSKLLTELPPPPQPRTTKVAKIVASRVFFE
jgi:hypothetical protein